MTHWGRARDAAGGEERFSRNQVKKRLWEESHDQLCYMWPEYRQLESETRLATLSSPGVVLLEWQSLRPDWREFKERRRGISHSDIGGSVKILLGWEKRNEVTSGGYKEARKVLHKVGYHQGSVCRYSDPGEMGTRSRQREHEGKFSGSVYLSRQEASLN